MKQGLAIILILIYVVAAAAVRKQTAWLAECSAVVPSSQQRLWDFSHATVDDREGEVYLTEINDTLFTVTLPSKRFEFIRKGQDVWRRSCENHFILLRDSVMMLEWSGAPGERHGRFFERGQAFQNRHIVSDGEWSFPEALTGVFITQNGDTIDNVTLRYRVSTQLYASTRCPQATASDSREADRIIQKRQVWLWTHPDYPFPLARTELAVDSTAAGVTGRKLMSWVTVNHGKAISPQQARRHGSSPGVPATGDDIFPEVSISVDGDILNVTVDGASAAGNGRSDGSHGADFGGNAVETRIILCDMLGRVFMESSGEMHRDISSLPQGDYLVNVRAGTQSKTYKIPLH